MRNLLQRKKASPAAARLAARYGRPVELAESIDAVRGDLSIPTYVRLTLEALLALSQDREKGKRHVALFAVQSWLTTCTEAPRRCFTVSAMQVNPYGLERTKPEGLVRTHGAKAAWIVARTDAAQHFGGVGIGPCSHGRSRFQRMMRARKSVTFQLPGVW